MCVDRSGISGSERGRINDQLWISAHSMPREGRVLCVVTQWSGVFVKRAGVASGIG